MKTKTLKKNKVNVITLGCSKNIYDSEVLMAQLKANHFEVEHESDKNDSEIVIINTCGFIENAKQESINTILQFAQERKKGKINKLYVTGCLSERYKPDLEKEIPEVDAYFGTRDLPRLLKTLKADYKHELVGERLLTTPLHYAYFKISEGCNRPCSFCAIPLMRGKHLSTPMEQLVQQAHRLAKSGTKELLLIAQDSTYYGLDIYNERKLAELMQRLAEIDGIEWIRLHYAFPSGFPEDVTEVINKYPNICKYIDMPLQHINNRILKSMRRGTTKEKTNELLYKIREKVPGVAIRTTLITGYPGETQTEHEEVMEWIEQMKFERLGVFTYSHEENTGAYSLKDDVSEEIKKERAAEIMQLQEEISYALNQNRVGQSMKILIDRKEGECFVGRTEFDSPEVDNEVLIDAKKYFCRIGDFVHAKIISADAFDLHAEPIN